MKKHEFCIPETNTIAKPIAKIIGSTDGGTGNYLYKDTGIKCDKPINISVTNTGGGGNPFVNWTGNTGNFGNTGNSTTNISTFNPPNMNIPTGSITQSLGNNIDQNSTQVIARYKNLMKGFTGQVLGGASHDGRHKRDYSEKPQVNKEMLSAVRMIDSKNNPKAVNFILFHDCYLNDDDMYWLTSVFNTHKRNIAVNTIDLSNNCISLTPTKNMPFFSFNYPFYTTWNVLRLDLSNNNIGDDGAKCIADGLAKGFFPITKQVNLSGNKITETGKGFIIKAIDKINHGISVTLETIQNASKETFKIGVKAMLSTSKNNGISTKEALTTEETIEHCKKGSWNVGVNLFMGYTKCFTGASTPIALYEMDGHSLLVNTTVSIINPLKKPMQFVCMTKETILSVADEEFANCLTGVDSGFNE